MMTSNFKSSPLKRLMNVVVMSVFFVSITASAVDMPDQFKSKNLATILGLQDEDKLDVEMVRKAAKKLYSKYHPDRYSDPKKYSKADQQMYTDITQIISEARDALVNYLEVNPDFNPKSSSTGSSNYSQKEHDNAQPFSWEDIFGERANGQGQAGQRSNQDSRSVVRGDHYGASLRGTMFEFLYQHPGFTQAIIPLEGRSANLGEVDMVMIIDPAIFPRIEIKLISKPSKTSNAPSLVKSFYATYVRGHHQGSGGAVLVDGIVYPNGQYLFNALHSQPRKWSAIPLDERGEKLYLQTNGLFFFTEMKPTFYSTGTSFTLINKEPLQFLPATNSPKAPEWKSLELGHDKNVIRLGYDGPGSCASKLR